MRLERWVKVKLEHQASNLNSILRKGKQLNCHDLICGFQKGSGSHIKDDWEGTDQEGEEHRQSLAVSRWRQRLTDTMIQPMEGCSKAHTHFHQ